MLTAYRLAMVLGAPLLRHHLQRRVMRGREDQARLGERYGVAGLSRPEGALAWCHAASVGEAVSLLPLIRELLVRYPALHVLVTTGTISSAAIMAKRLPDRAFHQFIPLDHPLWVDRFLRHWNPTLVLWIESEIWPNLLRRVAALNIPAAIVNARLSVKSMRRWRLLGKGLSRIMATFSVCLAQSTDDAARFHGLGIANVKIGGNLKFAIEPPEVDRTLLETMQAAVGERPLWLAANTHPGEEAMILGVHKILARTYPALLTIIVPRHPGRGGEIATMGRDAGLSVSCRSAGEAITADSAVYIADTLGEIGTFYELCPIAFIGGSYGESGLAQGGHNPIEAAQRDVAIVFGPDMRNNSGIARAILDCGGARQVGTLAALAALVRHWLANPDEATRIRAAALALAAANRAIPSQIVDELKSLLQRAGLEP